MLQVKELESYGEKAGKSLMLSPFISKSITWCLIMGLITVETYYHDDLKGIH